jgi:hypothetical protein
MSISFCVRFAILKFLHRTTRNWQLKEGHFPGRQAPK